MKIDVDKITEAKARQQIEHSIPNAEFIDAIQCQKKVEESPFSPRMEANELELNYKVLNVGKLSELFKKLNALIISKDDYATRKVEIAE